MWSVEQWSFRFHSKHLSWFPWWEKTWSSSWFMRRWILIFCPSSINLFKSNFFTELYDWIAHSHKGVRGWGHSDIHTEKELRFERELNPGPPAYTSDPRSRVVANKERWYSHANWSSLLAIALPYHLQQIPSILQVQSHGKFILISTKMTWMTLVVKFFDDSGQVSPKLIVVKLVQTSLSLTRRKWTSKIPMFMWLIQLWQVDPLTY